MKKGLRHGYTTGACAAAAALGAARMLRDQSLHREVELDLPAGFAATFRIEGGTFTKEAASCHVVKDAGDDPDVTNGAQVHAETALVAGDGSLLIEGGAGVGRVTKPGLAVPVGEAAINPVPRRMIEGAVRSVFPAIPEGLSLRVTISIPDGKERTKRTLNARLGIVGGLSILGTTGVVRPISHKAWTDTIDTAVDVAQACGVPAIVLSTGRTSEEAAQKLLPLPEEAFVMMGDHLEYALLSCRRKGVERVVLSVQFAKLVKIACGHGSTHVADSRMDLAKLAQWGRSVGLDETAVKTIECANTAREVFEGPLRRTILDEVATRALDAVCSRYPDGGTAMLLIDYSGREAGRWGDWSPL